MSLGALELQSLFRKYTGTLADLDLSEADSTRNYNQQRRDLRENRRLGLNAIRNDSASRNMTHSGVNLERQTDLEKAYDRAGADADAQRQADLARIAKLRLDAKGAYDEGVALSKMTSLLEKQNQGLM